MSESGTSWGVLRPLRRMPWSEREGRVTLFVPRLGRGTLARRVEGWLRVRPYQVHLDDVGSSVWHSCDGRTSVRDIAGRLRERFGERVEPVEDRLVEFLKSLARGRFVSLRSLSESPEHRRSRRASARRESRASSDRRGPDSPLERSSERA